MKTNSKQILTLTLLDNSNKENSYTLSTPGSTKALELEDQTIV